jgi:hypothetical protein
LLGEPCFEGTESVSDRLAQEIILIELFLVSSAEVRQKSLDARRAFPRLHRGQVCTTRDFGMFY